MGAQRRRICDKTLYLWVLGTSLGSASFRMTLAGKGTRQSDPWCTEDMRRLPTW
jgi:hypothetical protein